MNMFALSVDTDSRSKNEHFVYIEFLSAFNKYRRECGRAQSQILCYSIN